jgi:LacI family transcriptional regulator
MSEVAAKAGVSQATVSFVLGGGAERLKISPQTRERVMDAARELGYQRNQLARAMVTGKSRIIGLLTTSYLGDNILSILTGAMEVASQNDYLLKVVHLSYSDMDEAAIARCLEWRLAGAVVVGFSEEVGRGLHETFRQNQVPVAFIDNVPPLDWGVRICSNDEQGMEQVVSHLLARGHREIAFLGGQPSFVSDWRERSFRSALAGAGLPVPPHGVRHTSWNDQAVIETQVRGLFQESRDRFPTAVVCAADTIAMVVLRVARSLGLRLPDDLSVTGYSNASLSAFADPPLTTVDQSFHEMGCAAVRHLIWCAESEKQGMSVSPHPEILLPTRLLERGSTAAVSPR